MGAIRGTVQAQARAPSQLREKSWSPELAEGHGLADRVLQGEQLREPKGQVRGARDAGPGGTRLGNHMIPPGLQSGQDLMRKLRRRQGIKGTGNM